MNVTPRLSIPDTVKDQLAELESLSTAMTCACAYVIVPPGGMLMSAPVDNEALTVVVKF